MKKKLVILLIILGGLVMAFSLNGNIQKNKEAERNRQYEVSLVKALKNTYRDIEEIQISSPVYSSPPGDWSCYVEIEFSDKEKVGYHLGHSLDYEKNGSAVAQPNVVDILGNYYGVTHRQIKVKFSDGEEKNE